MHPVENLCLPVENLWKTPVPNKLQSYLKATVRGREILNQARYAFVSGYLLRCGGRLALLDKY